METTIVDITAHTLYTTAMLAIFINFYNFARYIHKSQLHTDHLWLAILAKVSLATAYGCLLYAWYHVVFLGYTPVPAMPEFIFMIAGIFTIGSFIINKYLDKK